MQKSVGRRNKAMYCVIVGDIIRSREIAPETREKVLYAAKNVFDRINTDYLSSLMAAFGMVRGDAFEGVLLTQYQAPKIIQEIIKAFYRVDKTVVRISVVTGQLTTVGSDRNETDGPAFYQAMDDLEKMKKRKSGHWLQVSFDTDSLAQPIVESQLRLLTALTEGWTDRQREIAWEMEAYSMQQKLVGKKLGISTPVINKQLKAANYEAYKLAWESLEKYLVAVEEATVEDKPPEKSYLAYYNVGLRRCKQYKFEESLPLLQKSLELAVADLGKDDLQLVPVYNALAEIYTQMSRFSQAEEAIQEAMRLQERLPKARLQYVETLQYKARMFYLAGDYKMEGEYLEEALNIARNILNEEHPIIGQLNNDLALLYREQNEFEGALSIYDSVLASVERGKADAPVDYAMVNYNIALCYYDMRKFKEAVSYTEEALAVFEENLPPNHEYIQNSRELLSDCKSHMGGDTE